MKLFISLVVVAVIAVTLSRSLKLSSKYERTPKELPNKKLSEWNAMDNGIDPTDEVGDTK
ncbi:hypothetical protein MCEMRE130_00600 [Candidatus Nanopelagicaceae bacterium]